jgi:hypothetical protein
MATKPNPRSTPAYRAWVKRVLSSCEPVCIRCGYPVDLDLPRTHPQGASADHEPPLAETGDLTPGMDGAGIAHLQCNRSHGGRLGSARATANRANGKAKPMTNLNKPSTRSLDKNNHTPAAPSPLPPEPFRKGQKAPVGPRMHPDGFVYPRLETGVHGAVRGSYGQQASDWLRDVYGLQLRGWQRYAITRALEHDEDGALVWPIVVLTVGRQSGKSVLSRAICMWRLHHADLFGETQTILHLANNVTTAMEVMRPAGLWAVEKYGKTAARWGNSSPQIAIPNGSRWLVRAANDSAGVGYSISMAFLDEAWRIPAGVWEDAVAPTLSERISPQGYLVSTAGESTSDLMIKYRQRAIDQLDNEDNGSILLLEWSAPADADPDDVDTWRWASPEWSDKRERFLRQQWQNVEESAWRREYLNQWVTRANHWLKDSVWTATRDPDGRLPTAGQWTVAVESDFDGMGHAVAIAALDDQGRYVVRVTTHRTIREVDERLAAIRAQHPQLYVMVTPTYAERLRERFDSLVGQREAVTATKVLLDLFDQKLIRHDGSQVLQEHFGNSTISKRSGGWVMTAPMGRGGVYAARAVMFAVAEAAKTPKPVPMIHTRRRA